MHYDAVIRTRGVSAELEATIAGLLRQTVPPGRIVIVNSLDEPAATEALQALGGVLVPYFDRPFNYARAINLGVEEVAADRVLIISSHSLLSEATLIEAGARAMGERGASGVYWEPGPAHREVLITRENFTGRNGLSNSCALLRTEDVRARPFDERLFSAEDQYWAKLQFEAGHSILRVETPALRYANPHHTAQQPNPAKIANEDVAIAYFVKPRLSWPDHVALRFAKALAFACLGRRDKAKVHWSVGVRLIRAWFREPTADSDYLRKRR